MCFPIATEWHKFIMRSLQADPKGNTLPEEDARLFVEALSGLRVLLDWQPPLVEKLLSYEGAPPGCYESATTCIKL